jgi:hypothetical protein
MKMHLYILLTALLLHAAPGMAQNKEFFLRELFFNRLPSARAEALGKAYTAIDGDLACIQFNPAGMARIQKTEFNMAQAPPGHYFATKAFYNFYAGGWRPSRYLQVGLSQFMYNSGNEQVLGRVTTPYQQRNTLTLSSEPLRNLLVGVNVNYLVFQPGNGDKVNRPVYIDAGLIKKIPLPAIHSSLNIGSSITNISKGSLTTTSALASIKRDIPMVWRSGVSYQWQFGRAFLLDTVHIVKLLGQVEWQQLLNSAYRKAIRCGAEAQLYNILALRCGYYYETIYNFGFPDANNNKLESITYGFGLQLPLHLLTRLPVNINIDYARLPQISYSRVFTDWPKFTSYTVRLNYAMAKKRRR